MDDVAKAGKEYREKALVKFEKLSKGTLRVKIPKQRTKQVKLPESPYYREEEL